MVKTLGALLLFAVMGLTLPGQNQVPDGGFESWSPDALNLYELPASGWWSCLNPLRTLGGPISVSKTTDAHSGTYAAEMTTEQYGTLLVPGMLLSGDFDLLGAPNYFTRGQPYTLRPTTFRGWYKYAPVQGDSGAIAVQLTKWNTTTLQRDTIAEVGLVIYQEVSAWTDFDLTLDYYSNEQPDTLVVVATSSAGGDNFQGQVGSTMWIDDFDLEFVTSQADPQEDALQVNWVPGREWKLQTQGQTMDLYVLNTTGQLLEARELAPGQHVLSTEGWPAGIYYLRLEGHRGGQTLIKRALIR